MYKVYYNGALIHDPSLMSPDYILLNGKCSTEAGKVDTMDFTILPNHPFYNVFTKLQTGIVAYRDNVEIFRGRILSSTVNMNGEKSVQCEGSLAYLLDTVQPIMKVDGTVSCANLFRTIIANHNNQVEVAKQFQVGIISATKANDQIEVNQTSYNETRSMIDSYLLNTKGGYLRVRFENGVQYIDWIEDFGRNPNQPFMIGANIVEMSEENSTDDFYTILLPLGKEEAGEQTTEEEIEEDEARDHTVFVSDVNGGSPYMPVSNEFVQAYGKIYHMEDYGTVSSPAELKSMANDTLDQFRKKLNRTVEITGLDLHFLDPNYDQILIGDRVNIIAPNFNKNETLMATKIDYDFSKPQGDRYSFGDGVLSLTRKTENGISTTKKTAEKARDNSLTNGRDLLIKKNLIDIEANKFNLKVNDAMNITAKYVKWTFDAMAFGGKSYSYSPADQQRIRGELADRWSDITRTMEGYISPEQGLADFRAISDIVTNAAEQVNTIYMHLDSDQGLFQWGVESKNLAGLGNEVNNVKLILNGPNGTGGLVSQVSEIDETGKQQGRLLREAGIYVNPDTGAWLFNTDYTTGLGSVIKAQDDKASMVVTTNQDGTYAVNVGEIALAFNNQTGQSTARINADKIMISTGSQYSPLDSYLALQDGKINLVVHTDAQGNWVINPASIVAAVNNGESSLVFNADHLDLRGLVTITDMHAEYGTGDQLSVNDIDCDGLLAENIEAAMVTANYFIDANGNFLNNAVKTVQIISAGNNSYKLQYNTFDNNNWQDAGTFSRATTLTGAWSSGVYTVTASPQGNTISTEVSMGPGRWDSNTPNLYRGDIYYSNDGGDNAYPTGATYVVDATSRYNAGYAAGMIDGSVTTLGGSWNNGTFTVTATPQGDTISVGLFDVPASDVTWNGNTASFPVKANLDGGETAYNTGKTLSIDATSRYNAGYSDGQSDGGLLIDYENGNISAANSSTKVAYIEADVGLSYDSTTHKYTATGMAKVAPSGGSYSNMDSTSTTSGTEAYGDGYVAGYDDNITAYIEEAENNDGAVRTLSYDENYVVHARYKNYEGVSARSNATYSSYTIKAPADRYSEGYSDGQSDGGLAVDYVNNNISAANSPTKVVYIQAASSISYNSTAHTYTATGKAQVSPSGSGYYDMDTDTAVSGTEAYESGVTAGYGSARLSLNTADHTINIGNTGNLVSAAVQVSGSVGEYDSTNESYPVVIKALVNGVEMNANTIQVACEPSGAYDDGYDAGYAAGQVTTLSGSWSNGTFTVTASPQGNTISTMVSMGPGSWSGNTFTGDIYYSNDGGENSYPTGAQYVVDATSRYNAGDTAGYNRGYSTGYNANNTAYIEESGKTLGYSESFTVHARYKNYEGVSARSNAENSSITITAPADRYNDGYTQGYGSARLSLNTANHTINIGNTGNRVSAAVGVSGVVGEYDYMEEGIPIAVSATVDGVEMATRTVWAVCDPEGSYNEGFNDGEAYGREAVRSRYTPMADCKANVTAYGGGSGVYIQMFVYERGQYYSAGTHYWYYSSTRGAPVTYYRYDND